WRKFPPKPPFKDFWLSYGGRPLARVPPKRGLPPYDKQLKVFVGSLRGTFFKKFPSIFALLFFVKEVKYPITYYPGSR
ncbi:MAG TPA: hypothetical protein VJM57_04625, partial [Thermodesulfobacteriota bacterium]|nr:hypothetical protein [Thermodesulfobacteriota bacterium]